MAWEDAAIIATSSARTVTGNSGAVICPKSFNLGVQVQVSAVSGTGPSCVFTVEWSMDGTNFGPANTPDAFTAVSATGNPTGLFAVKAPFFRLVWTITGTSPSFTFQAYKYGIGG